MKITGDYKGKKVGISDICLKPLEPDNEACTMFSPLQYWQMKKTNLDACYDMMDQPCDPEYPPDPDLLGEDWHDQILACTRYYHYYFMMVIYVMNQQ